MAKRTGEQSLRDDLAAAGKLIEAAAVHRDRLQERVVDAQAKVDAAVGHLRELIAEQDRIVKSLAVLTGDDAEPARPTRTDMDVDDSQEPSPRDKQRILRHAERELAEGKVDG